MEDIKSFILFIQLFLNRGAKPIFHQWLNEYFRDHPLPVSNSSMFDPLALMSSADVCKALKCNRHHLYSLLRENKISGIRKGNALRFRRQDIQDYLDREFNQNP